jgi:hypothetical protein
MFRYLYFSYHIVIQELSAVNLVQTVNCIGQFMQHAETIERAVVARTMGTMGDPKLRDEILAMKRRMISALAREKGSSDTVIDLYAALDAGQTQTAIQLAKTLTDEYYDIGIVMLKLATTYALCCIQMMHVLLDCVTSGSDSETDTRTWSARINRLVSLCEGALRFTFDLSNLNAAISSDHMRRATRVGAAPSAQSLPVSEVSELDANGFVCPITLDGALELMLLLVDNHDGHDEQDQQASQPVLAGLDKDVINDLIDCPLNLFRYPDVVQRLAAKLDHPISLLAYRDADRSGMPFTRSPLTRRLISGGICLGSSEAHCKASTWALSHAISGGKLAGNIDLWFACVWLLIEQGNVPRLAELLPQFRRNMQYRLRTHSTFMSLVSRPEFPSTRVKLGVASWYVFASCAFGLPPHQDVMRFHLPHIAQLKQLLNLTGFSVPVEVNDHIGRLRVVLSMLGWVKKDRHRLPNLMLALKQRCLRVKIAEINATVSETEHVQEFIPVDGTPTLEQTQVVYSLLPAHFRMFNAKTLFGLAALVDSSKSGADVSLLMEWQPAEIAAAVVEWDHGVGDIALAPIRICTATCRPFFRPCAASQDTWNQLSERFYGLVPPKLVSHDFHFGNFVLKYKFYPSRDEFLTYLHNRVVVHGVSNHITLPAQQDVFLTRVFARHATVLSEISDPAEFIRRFNASRSLDVRAEMEAAERDA